MKPASRAQVWDATARFLSPKELEQSCYALYGIAGLITFMLMFYSI